MTWKEALTLNDICIIYYIEYIRSSHCLYEISKLHPLFTLGRHYLFHTLEFRRVLYHMFDLADIFLSHNDENTGIELCVKLGRPEI